MARKKAAKKGKKGKPTKAKKTSKAVKNDFAPVMTPNQDQNNEKQDGLGELSDDKDDRLTRN
jgi:uncharacterized protein YaaR (DUF327 family)